MKYEKIQFREVFKEGWKLTKENLGFLCGYSVILLALSWLGQFGLEKMAYPYFYFLGLMPFLVIPYLGFNRSAILIMKGIKPKFDQLYSNWKLFVPCIMACLIIVIMFVVLAALIVLPSAWIIYNYELAKEGSNDPQNRILLISLVAIVISIPSMWMYVRFGFFPYFIVDKNCGPIDSLKGSYRATRGNVWPLLKIYLVICLIGLVGALTYGIIGIITGPLLTLVLGISYRKLTTPEVGL